MESLRPQLEPRPAQALIRLPRSQRTTARALPTPLPAVRRESHNVRFFLPPLIEQERPAGARSDYDGEATCGPTSMAMIARVLGFWRRATDGELIDYFSTVGRTTREDGTELAGMLAIAKAMGRDAELHAGGDLCWLSAELKEGKLVVANGEYYAMPPHEDASQREGHYVLVYGMEANGDFLVRDPGDPKVRAVRPEHLRRYFEEHRDGGFQIAVDPVPKLGLRERVLLHRKPVFERRLVSTRKASERSTHSAPRKVPAS